VALPPRPRSAVQGGYQGSRGLRLRLGRGPKTDGASSCLEQQAQSVSVASASTQATDQCGMVDFCASQSMSSMTPTHELIGEPSFCAPSTRPSYSFCISDVDLGLAAPPRRRPEASTLSNGRPKSAVCNSQPSQRPRTAPGLSTTPPPLRKSCTESARALLEEQRSAVDLICDARNSAHAMRSMSSSSLRRPCEEGGVLAGKYRTVRFLGRGTSASVWEAEDSDSGGKFAIKVFDKSKNDWNSHSKHAVREAKLLQNLKHPAIVRVHETLDTPKFFHIVLDLVVGGSLRELVRKQGSPGLGEESSRRLFHQICEGVCFLHLRNFVHRDIKLENILVESETGDAKIIDFGFALMLRSTDQRLRVFCGTPSYMAPELVMNQEYSGFCTDMWALGVVLFGMLAGRLPFEGQTESQLYAKIRRAQFKFPGGVPELPRRVVSGILRVDATARPTAAQVVQHRWVTSQDIDEAEHSAEGFAGPLAKSACARPSSVPAAARRLRGCS